MQIAVTIDIADQDFAKGWNSDETELCESVKATLHELVGDDGAVYVPTVTLAGAVCQHCKHTIKWLAAAKEWADVQTGLVFCAAPHRGTSHKPA